MKREDTDFWYDKVYSRVWNTFNVDYRTIDDKWIDTMAKTDMQIEVDVYAESLYEKLQAYVKDMKKNKTIVECDRVVIDPSFVYYGNFSYYIRCYVHYRIVSTKTKAKYTVDELLLGPNKSPYNSILFSRTGLVDLTGHKLGEWVDGIFDVAVASAINSAKPETYGVSFTEWSVKKAVPYER